MQSKCKYCGAEFVQKRRSHIYCSKKCCRKAEKLLSTKGKPRIEREVTPAMKSFFYALANRIINKGGTI